MSIKPFSEIRNWSSFQWSLAVLIGIFLTWGSSQLVNAWNQPNADTLAMGRELFEHEWTQNDSLSADGDGLGPVFNAKSCVECHFQGAIGGGGPNDKNVTSFTALSNPQQSTAELISGVVHADALESYQLETAEKLRLEFPIIKGVVRNEGHCTYREPDIDPLIVETINTPALFGMGEIDRISGLKIKNARRWKLLSNVGQELQGKFDSIPAGRPRILPDGRVGKFGWKAQFATLEEFVAAACAVEIGLTNPMRAQDLPHTHQPDPEAGLDLDKRQFKALVHFCSSLPVPEEVSGNTPEHQHNIDQGKQLFSSIGCAECHTPEVDGVVGVYSDFLLYSLEGGDQAMDSYDDFPEDFELPSAEPDPSEWKTPPLWGVADSAPYMHDGSAPTLSAAIAAHNGAARTVKSSYLELSRPQQKQLLAFLKSLRAPQSNTQPSEKGNPSILAASH
ncbi:MAG: c-type cytochrome [Planctomycetaceae bacterium]|nr:c-type cytochrome [Planctomycetaceae bacterium]